MVWICDMEDPRSDEQLVADFLAEDEPAFEALHNRYFKQIGFYIKKQGILKDDSFIDDVRQIVLVKVFTLLKQGRFTARGPGSFRAFIYETAQRITFDQNEKRFRLVKPVTDVFTTEELFQPDELRFHEPETTDYDLINDRVKKVLGQLTPEEQELMQLVANKIKYRDIIKRSEFSKYSVDYLKDKIYNIRKKVSKGVNHEEK